MKLKFLGIYVSVCLFACASCVVAASAAVVDRTAPYNGEYFIAYNGDLGNDGVYASGTLPSYLLADGGEEAGEGEEKPAPPIILQESTDENGRTIYGIEPHDLDKIKVIPRTVQPFSARVEEEGEPQYGDERNFFAIDYAAGTESEIPFVLKYCGKYCNVWLEAADDHGITDEIATELGAEYDVKIHNQLQAAFGPIYDRDGDGKLAILLYDIKDSYPGTSFYVAGLFSSSDLWTDETNCMDAIHIDTYPSIVNSSRYGDLTEVKGTLVHETQHLIEASAWVMDHLYPLPSWIDEGLALAAEHEIYGPRTSRIENYKSQYRPGMSLTEFTDEDPIPHYALYYLFFQYLRTQTKDYIGGGSELYKTIIHSPKRGTQAVEESMRQFDPYVTLDDLVLDFYIALALNEPTGRHGFAGEPAFATITQSPLLYSGTAGMNLGGGAALVRRQSVSNYTPAAQSEKISYAAFSRDPQAVDAPRASDPSGEYYQFKAIYLFCRERGGTIYYTLDGSTPNENSMIYTGKPIPLVSSGTLKAVTISSDKRASVVSEYRYTVVQEDVELFRRTVVGFVTEEEDDDYSWGAVKYKLNLYGNDVAAALDGSGLVQVGYVQKEALGRDDTYGLIPHDGTNDFEGYIAKYGHDGKPLWIHNLGGDSDTRLQSVAATNDGYVAAGFFNRQTVSTPHAGDFEGIELVEGESACSGFLVKFNLEGEKQWITALPCTRKIARLSQVIVCPDGGYVVVGQYSDSSNDSGPTDAVIAKIDVNGKLLWRKDFSGDGSDGFEAVAILADETIVAVGGSQGQSFETGDWEGVSAPGETNRMYAMVVAFGQDGNLLWKQGYPFYNRSSKTGKYLDVIPLEDGGFCIASEERISFRNEVFPAVIAFDPDGTRRWIGCFSKNTPGAEQLSPPIIGSGSNDYLSIFAIAPAEDGVMAFFNYDREMRWNDALEHMSTGHVCSVVAVKYNLEGEIDWISEYTSNYKPDRSNNSGAAAIALGDRQYVVCGSTAIYRDQIFCSQYNHHAFLFAFNDESAPYYTVSGSVGLPGVSVGKKLSDSQGNFKLRVMEGKEVTLTPTLSGYTFEPVSLTVGPVTEDSSGHSFTAAEIRYTLSGTVRDQDGNPLSGVSVGDEITGEDGSYRLSVRPGTNVLLEPSLPDTGFEPVNRMVSLVEGDVDGLDFQVPKPTYTVMGKVTKDGQPQGGVQLGGTATAPDGTYSVTVAEGESLTLVPVFQGYSFEPAQITLGPVTEDHTEQDFSMTADVAFLTVSPTVIDFGTVKGGESPAAVTVAVKNHKGKTCSGLAVTLSENSCFTVTQPTSTSLDVGETLTFTVSPKPGLPAGTYSETVTIGNNTLTKTVTVTVTVQIESGSDPVKPPSGGDDRPGGSGASGSGTSGGGSSKDDDSSGKGSPVEQEPPAPIPEPVVHSPYLEGYKDGLFHPEDDLTRAQCATMLARLSEGFEESAHYEAPLFDDVGADRWFTNYIAWIRQKGLMNGYPDGTFRPDNTMTRGEFAATACRAMGLGEGTVESPFSDAAGHWASRAIGQLTYQGILSGYPDGTFRPEAPITRAEAAKILNRVYERRPDGDLVSGEELFYPDVQKGHWAYDDIWEASVEHTHSH